MPVLLSRNKLPDVNYHDRHAEEYTRHVVCHGKKLEVMQVPMKS